MKKILILLISLLIFSSCNKEEEKEKSIKNTNTGVIVNSWNLSNTSSWKNNNEYCDYEIIKNEINNKKNIKESEKKELYNKLIFACSNFDNKIATKKYLEPEYFFMFKENNSDLYAHGDTSFLSFHWREWLAVLSWIDPIANNYKVSTYSWWIILKWYIKNNDLFNSKINKIIIRPINVAKTEFYFNGDMQVFDLDFANYDLNYNFLNKESIIINNIYNNEFSINLTYKDKRLLPFHWEYEIQYVYEDWNKNVDYLLYFPNRLYIKSFVKEINFSKNQCINLPKEIQNEIQNREEKICIWTWWYILNTSFPFDIDLNTINYWKIKFKKIKQNQYYIDEELKTSDKLYLFSIEFPKNPDIELEILDNDNYKIFTDNDFDDTYYIFSKDKVLKTWFWNIVLDWYTSKNKIEENNFIFSSYNEEKQENIYVIYPKDTFYYNWYASRLPAWYAFETVTKEYFDSLWWKNEIIIDESNYEKIKKFPMWTSCCLSWFWENTYLYEENWTLKNKLLWVKIKFFENKYWEWYSYLFYKEDKLLMIMNSWCDRCWWEAFINGKIIE